MIVVADTSPILNLARIERLQLLPSLYQQVLIPTGVWAELVTFQNSISALNPANNTWLVVAEAEDHDLVHRLRQHLDIGEAEAIALAVERRASLLLIDEKRGRQAAETLGMSVTGLIGLLAEAKQVRLIEQVGPVLDELIAKARFWIAPSLYRQVLAELGEL